MNKENLWQVILADLEVQVSKVVFQTLFSQTTLLSLDLEKNQAVVGCKKPLLVNLIEKRYAPLIKKTFALYLKKEIDITFTTTSTEKKKEAKEPLFTLPVSSPQTPLPKLNPDYTFENFAVSSSNQMAYAAATAVAQTPGTSYNPLFLYGGVGVGKTHLMQAIAHRALTKNPKLKIIYSTGEEFTNEIIEAISNKTTSSFKKKYRKLEMLLIDDVQFIAGKYSIQEEFFHTFNAIQQVKGQIVLTSDKPPEEMNRLEARLRSRFEGGLTIDIGPPDFELRTAILLIKVKKMGVSFPIEYAKLLAANIEDTRKLEGALIRVVSEAKIKNIPLSKDLIRKVIGKTISEVPKKKNLPPNQILETVASYFQLKPSHLKGNRRDKVFSLPRQILYYLLRVEAGLPLMEIGELLGGKDHTTVLYGVRKISQLLSTDEKLRNDVLGIKEKLFG